MGGGGQQGKGGGSSRPQLGFDQMYKDDWTRMRASESGGRPGDDASTDRGFQAPQGKKRISLPSARTPNIRAEPFGKYPGGLRGSGIKSPTQQDLLRISENQIRGLRTPPLKTAPRPPGPARIPSYPGSILTGYGDEDDNLGGLDAGTLNEVDTWF